MTGGDIVSRRWKIAVTALGVAGIVSTPVIWLLDSPDAGQMAGASIQGAVGVVALLWALFQRPGGSAEDLALRTGRARAADAGTAVTGVRRASGGAGGSAKAECTGDATATGEGSRAVSGIDYS
ncbi:hypothetical protein [Streptomyces sp. IBSBF 2806]|uniref:hypothetical protein n=1 Tax=Streptomyces sp. IBSBF 2806 TaxID=2903529 RepID=UPI002FDC09D4